MHYCSTTLQHVTVSTFISRSSKHWKWILLKAVLIHCPSTAWACLLMFPVAASGLFHIGSIPHTSNTLNLWMFCLIPPQELVTMQSYLLVWSLDLCLHHKLRVPTLSIWLLKASKISIPLFMIRASGLLSQTSPSHLNMGSSVIQLFSLSLNTIPLWSFSFKRFFIFRITNVLVSSHQLEIKASQLFSVFHVPLLQTGLNIVLMNQFWSS